MNRKIIIVITVLICLCAALVTAQHFVNKEAENTTAPVALTEAPQTDAPTETSSAENTSLHTNKPERSEYTEKPSEKQTESNSEKNSTQQQSTNADKKPTGTKPTETEKNDNVQDTSKPQKPDKENTSKSTSKPQKPDKENTSESTNKPQKPDKESTSKSSNKPQKPDKESNSESANKPQKPDKESTSQATEKPQDTTTTEAKKQTVSVTISINCAKALAYDKDVPASGYFLAPSKYIAEEGDTVFDILEAVTKENDIALTYQSKSYIQAIGGLKEKDCGGGSGWTYIVNGTKPNKSSAKYVVAEGDIIEWYYVTNPTD